jgi:hypothetical protein
LIRPPVQPRRLGWGSIDKTKEISVHLRSSAVEKYFPYPGTAAFKRLPGMSANERFGFNLSLHQRFKPLRAVNASSSYRSCPSPDLADQRNAIGKTDLTAP